MRMPSSAPESLSAPHSGRYPSVTALADPLPLADEVRRARRASTCTICRCTHQHRPAHRPPCQAARLVPRPVRARRGRHQPGRRGRAVSDLLRGGVFLGDPGMADTAMAGRPARRRVRPVRPRSRGDRRERQGAHVLHHGRRRAEPAMERPRLAQPALRPQHRPLDGQGAPPRPPAATLSWWSACVPARVDTRWWRDATRRRVAGADSCPAGSRFGEADARAVPVRRDRVRASCPDGTAPSPHGARRPRAEARSWFPRRSDAKTCSAACRKALQRSQVTGRKRDRKQPRERQSSS